MTSIILSSSSDINLREICIYKVGSIIINADNKFNIEEYPALSIIDQLQKNEDIRLESLNINPNVFIGGIQTRKDLSNFNFDSDFRHDMQEVKTNVMLNNAVFRNIEFFTIFDYYKKTETLPIPSLVKSAIKEFIAVFHFFEQQKRDKLNFSNRLFDFNFYVLKLLDMQHENNLSGLSIASLNINFNLDHTRKDKLILFAKNKYNQDNVILLTQEDVITIRTRIENLMETFDYPNDLFSRLDDGLKFINRSKVVMSKESLRRKEFHVIRFNCIKNAIKLDLALNVYDVEIDEENKDMVLDLTFMPCSLSISVCSNMSRKIVAELDKLELFTVSQVAKLLDLSSEYESLYPILENLNLLNIKFYKVPGIEYMDSYLLSPYIGYVSKKETESTPENAFDNQNSKADLYCLSLYKKSMQESKKKISDIISQHRIKSGRQNKFSVFSYCTIL